MTAEGHIVRCKLLSAGYVFLNGIYHHIVVGGRPCDLKTETAVGCLEVITHVGVSAVAVIIAAFEIVVAVALDTLLGVKHIAQRKGQIAIARGIEAGRMLIPGGIGI